MGYYTKISGTSGAPIGTIVAIGKKNGTFTISDYPGYLLCDGTQYYVAQYPALAKVLAAHYDSSATAVTTLSGSLTNWDGSSNTSMGTFKVPDYRGKKLVGVGGVAGVGSVSAPVTKNRFNQSGGTSDEVGALGGQWVMNETRQGAEYVVGSVTVSGYSSVTGTITTSMSGNTSYRIGPLDEEVLRKPPEHGHILLTSQPDPTATGEKDTGGAGAAAGGLAAAEHADDTNGYIYPWDPLDLQSHSHKISEINHNQQKPKDATYDYNASSSNNTNLGANGPGNAFYNDSSGATGAVAVSSSNAFDYIDKYVTAADTGITLSDGTFVLTAATPISMTAALSPVSDIPLLMAFFRVNYIIKAY